MKNAIITLVLAALVLGVSGIAEADTVELNLFDLGCPTRFDFNSPYWQTDFDLGVTFSGISHVYIDWSGEITAGLAISYDDPCNPFPLRVGIGAAFYPPLRYAVVWGGEQTYPLPEPFDSLSEIKPSTWSDLLDGQGMIGLQSEVVIMANGRYIEYGSINLDNATLIIEGTVVPEPATFILLVLGFTQIIRRRSYNPIKRTSHSNKD
jgi:hypothetical protein